MILSGFGNSGNAVRVTLILTQSVQGQFLINHIFYFELK